MKSPNETAGIRLANLRLLIVFLLIGCCNPLQARSGEKASDPQAVASRLQQTYNKTTSITVQFQQVTTLKMSRQIRKGNGKMSILKPGRMRWDYQTPEEQVIICDGEKIRMYFAKTKQLMVAPAKEYIQSDVTYGFFAGTGDITRDFIVSSPDLQQTPDISVLTEAEKNSRESQIIRLSPRLPHPHVDYLHVWVDSKTSMVNQLQIVDQLGSVTDLVFSKIKINESITEESFIFTPPVGTELIEN
ncbi:MAG: hypothetical protein A2511_05840 [Deltaproteobacteria bacterium RIFOXYD12_FULL_50_9]|nr:MAG: hypothetical protein A2511_05840 [Deltaproteobacteria bacterium RIFOXYD12_FULL_50_9]